MECPHLEENVKIHAPPSINGNREWCCSVCKTEENPWMCLCCGIIGCGRFVNGHAKTHHEDLAETHCDQERTPLHCVCMDCTSWAVFCYSCDEFVINDTASGQVDQTRKLLQTFLSSQENHTKENHTKENDTTENDTTENDTKENHTKENHDSKRSRRRAAADSGGNNQKRLKTDDRGKVKPKTSGLRNLGNTCFMNAVLQSLSNIQSFCGYIKQLPSLEQKLQNSRVKTRRSKDGEDIFVVEELRKTLVSLWQGSKSAISPECLFSVIWKVVPRFRGYQQQDAHEFMRYLLDRLHTELLTLLPYPNPNSPFIGPKGKSTIVTAIFGGILQSEVHCLICAMNSTKHDPFLDLSLDIPTKFTAKTPNPKNGEPVCDITDCLKSFTDVEELEDTELYMCSNCKQRQRSTKRFWVRRLPNVLCLHLKRFRWQSCFRMKLDAHVNFPLHGLEMSRYMLNNVHETRNSFASSNEYDLAAVIVHHGSGAGSGHYTSYAVHENHWYHFNDSSVSLCEEDTVMRCKAYILFYVRRDIRVPDYLSVKNATQ